ncbi:MAG TPA: spore coat associated protein CotJA [Clostridia bacterium]|nr:spore coat associated protein CotJA [Clostridia bacterium]
MDQDIMKDLYDPKDREISAFPSQTPVGMAYVPVQKFRSVYEPDVGLMQGTIFPDLDKPWLGNRAFSDHIENAGMERGMGQ